jgi:hypothetical protein
MEERVFFENNGVKVTNARFIVRSQTYAMNGVTSVKSHVTSPDRKGPLIAIGIGLLVLLAADGAGKLIGLAIAAFGVWLFMQQKDTHAVFLSSSSGEVEALSNQDEEYIGGVVSALNEALVYRG